MRRLVFVIFLVPTAISCDAQHAARTAASSNSLQQFGLSVQNYHNVFQDQAGREGAANESAQDNNVNRPTAGRQIIYRASINLHVKSFAETDKRITQLVNESGG